MTAYPAPLLLVGGGKMGGALLAGWLKRGLNPDDAFVVDPGVEAADFAAKLGVRAVANATMIPPGLKPKVIVLAIKPQLVHDVLPAYAKYTASACFLSIAAGKTIASLQKHLGASAPVVRAMPNTPAAVGRGISGVVASASVSAADRQACGELLNAVGEVVWLDDEAEMDAVTAVSGSGPAYVFLLIEALASAGVAAGLSAEVAGKLARATVCGAGELAWQAAEPAGQLRRNVTSPNGTTQAALEVLMAADGLEPLLTRAVAAAARRSRELAN